MSGFEVQIIRRVRCPVCDTTRVKVYTTRSDGRSGRKVRYYECLECKDLHSREPTRFKVVVV